jgi:hypothetical protein
LHHQRLGGELTLATSPDSAGVHGGKADVVFAVSLTVNTPFTGCGGGSRLSAHPVALAIVATLNAAAHTSQFLAMDPSLPPPTKPPLSRRGDAVHGHLFGTATVRNVRGLSTCFKKR